MQRPIEAINTLIGWIDTTESLLENESSQATRNFLSRRLKYYQELLAYIEFLEGKK